MNLDGAHPLYCLPSMPSVRIPHYQSTNELVEYNGLENIKHSHFIKGELSLRDAN